MDNFSRYLLVLKLCPSIAPSCLIGGLENALEEAMNFTALPPEQIITLVTNSGDAMTDEQTRRYLETSPYLHVTGRRNYPQTIGKMESLIGSIKYEEISFRKYRNPADAQACLDLYRQHFNKERPHQSLNYRVPYELYTGRKPERTGPLRQPDGGYSRSIDVLK